jgi:Leucine carboxyl methyltransferase
LINAAVEVIGDSWSSLVLGDITFGNRRHFLVLQEPSEEGMPQTSSPTARKRRILQRLFGRVPERVALVAADLETDDLAGSRAALGFRPDLPTLFVLEAVTQYLTDDAAGRLFALLGEAPASSRLIFTYAEKGLLEGRNLDGWESAHRKWVQKYRVWRYGLEPAAVGGLLHRHGWTEREQIGAEEYRTRYFLPARRNLTAMDIERPEGHLAAGEAFLTVDAPFLQAGVAEDVEPPNKHGREERAREVTLVVTEERERTEDLRGAPPAVSSILVRPVPLHVIPRAAEGSVSRPRQGSSELLQGSLAKTICGTIP